MHRAIRERLTANGRALRELARATGVDAGNLSRFLHCGRGLGVARVNRLCEELGMRFAGPGYPPGLVWLERADHWGALLAPRLPGLDPAELRQIVVSILRPADKRRFILRPVGGGHAL